MRHQWKNARFLVITKLTKQDLGGYSGEVPPLPIPNREVKLTNADGTAYLSGRVGSRLFKEQIERFAPFFCCYMVLEQRKVATFCVVADVWRLYSGSLSAGGGLGWKPTRR